MKGSQRREAIGIVGSPRSLPGTKKGLEADCKKIGKEYGVEDIGGRSKMVTGARKRKSIYLIHPFMLTSLGLGVPRSFQQDQTWGGVNLFPW